MNGAFLTPLIFIGCGLVFFFIFFYLKQKRNRLLSLGIPVEGIVFDFVSRMSNDSSNQYPVIRFVTLNQEWITQTYKISYPGFVLKRGQKVAVFYNPDKPSDFILNLKIDIWLLRIFAAIATVFFILAIFLTINVYKTK